MRIPALSLNQKLSALAFVLGLMALAAQPYQGSRVRLDSKELAVLVQREADHLTPGELADWIVQERADYRLLDLRDPKAFGEYPIPSAENVPLAVLTEAPVARAEKIVLYSEGGIHGTQAWVLMKAGGFRSVYNLRGGLEGWKDEVLFPLFPEKPAAEEKARLERVASVSRFFGGSPRAGSASPAGAPQPLPAVRVESAPATGLPSLPSGPAGAATPKKGKKKEGC